MLKSYFKTAFRHLLRNKVFSLINISGLAIGIAVCMLIYLFIVNEFSFDRFHKDEDRIYRVMRGFNKEGDIKQVAYLSGLYGPALMNDFGSDITSMVRTIQNNNLVTIDDRSFSEKKVLDADSNFFTFFSFPLILGDPKTALTDRGSIVLTKTTAKKYFGSAEAAMGKMLKLDKETLLKVTGITKDIPANSTIDFDMVVPIKNYEQEGIMTVWINNGLYTYVKLAPGVQAQQLESHFPAFMQKYLGSDMRKFGFDFTLSLMPLKDVHFAKDAFDSNRHGDKTIVFIFLSVAILILLIACINFMNLSSIRALERSREIGMRKVLGAVRPQLIYQFLGESVMITSIACMLAIGLVLLAQPWYSNLLDYQLSISWSDGYFWMFLAGIIILVGLLAGCYPAFFLSAFRPILALKGKLRLGKGSTSFRQVLVVLQFSISVFLITAVMAISRQMNFIKNKSLGYNQEQLLVIPINNEEAGKNKELLKQLVAREPGVISVSLMSGEPGGFYDSHIFDVEGHTERKTSRTEFSDFEIVKTLGLKIIAGRDFSSAFPTDTTNAVLVNRSFASKMGWTSEEAVGKWLQNTVRDTAKRLIIGVVADFNYQSLKSDIEPLVIAPNEDWRLALVKLAAGNIAANIRAIEDDYSQIAPGYTMDYQFLDQQFDNLYKKDLRQQSILSVFAILAIFVSCLGLLGLTIFNTSKRIKEIGIRKVLGSSVMDILILISVDLLRPVIIAICIALPLAVWAISRWMQNFAYKATIPWWIYFLAVLTTFSIAFFTISVKSISAARANPVKSLRSE